MLRSPNGTMLSQMYQYNRTYDLSVLPQHDYNLVVLLMSITGNSAKSVSKYGMNGMMQGLFPDGQAAVNELQKRGWVTRESTLDEALNVQKLPELKNALRAKGMKVSGSKEDLICRLSSALTDDEKQTLISSVLLWRPTSLGYEYIRSLYEERYSMEKLTIEAFLAYDFKKGTDIVRRYKVRFPVSGGINCGDYSSITQDSDLLSRFFSKSNMDTLSAIACFQYSFGGDLMFPLSTSEDTPDIQSKHKLEIRYINSSICTFRDFESYRSAGLTYYDVLCCDDSCKICMKAAQHPQKVSEGEIGKSAPPFHLGCRCCTVAHFPK